MTNALISAVEDVSRIRKLTNRSDRLEAALEFAIPMARKWVENGQVYIPHIDTALNVVTERFVTVKEKRGFGANATESFLGYDVEDADAKIWAELFYSSARAENFIRDAISANILFERAFPPGLRHFVFKLVRDQVDRPSKKTSKPSLEHRDTLLSGIAKKVSETFKMQLGASKETYRKSRQPPVRGCTIAAATLAAVGIPRISPDRADAIVRNKQLPVEKAESSAVFYVRWPKTGARRVLLDFIQEDPSATPEEMLRGLQYFAR